MKITQIVFLIFLMSIGFSCNAEDNSKSKQANKEVEQQAEEVKVYYFHMTRRCYTCKNVEKVSKEAVQELENENVSFKAFNIEKAEGKEKAKELGISGQTLLISGAGKKFNITRQGFINVRQPEKLKKIIHQKINSIL